MLLCRKKTIVCKLAKYIMTNNNVKTWMTFFCIIIDYRTFSFIEWIYTFETEFVVCTLSIAWYVASAHVARSMRAGGDRGGRHRTGGAPDVPESARRPPTLRTGTIVLARRRTYCASATRGSTQQPHRILHYTLN